MAIFLAHNLCQSQLDGRNGSSACTLRDMKVCISVLGNSLPVFDLYGSPLQCTPLFIQSIREGNHLYDNSPAAATGDLLGAFDAVAVLPNVRVAKELGFRNAENCSEVLESIAR